MGIQERKRQKRIREYVIERDGAICCYCDMPLTPEKITLDHIQPDSKRGTFNTTNLTIACAPCNNKRGNKPFFEFCQQFEWSEDKLDKYRRLYFNNLRIKILNIAKEECMLEDQAIPINLIKQACRQLKIKGLDFSSYEAYYSFDVRFDEICDRRKVKFVFEQLIRILEAESR